MDLYNDNCRLFVLPRDIRNTRANFLRISHVVELELEIMSYLQFMNTNIAVPQFPPTIEHLSLCELAVNNLQKNN